MDRTVDFLKAAGTFYLATADGDQPRVRPFGIVFKYNDRLYIGTNNKKECFRQMKANPKVEICAMKKGEWIRLSGTIEQDTSLETKKAFLDASPSIQSMYKADDGIFEVFYFTEGVAVFNSFGREPETEKIG